MALILIADPSASERQRLRQIIEGQDHVVVEADGGAYCLEIAEYHHPQCVFFNLLLLDAAETDLLPSFKQLDIPTIFITSDSLTQSEQRYLGWQAAAVLGDVPESDILLDTLTAILINGTAPKLSSPLSVSQDAPATPPGTTVESTTSAQANAKELLSLDNLQGVVGEGIAQATVALNEITGCPLTFESPQVETLTSLSMQKRLQDRFGDTPVCATQLPFAGGLTGTAQLFFPQESAISLTTVLTGEDLNSPDIHQLKQEALTEIGNIVLNSVMGAMSNALGQSLAFSVPVYLESEIATLSSSLTEEHDDAAILLAQTQFLIEEFQITGDIILFFKMRLFFNLMQDAPS